MPARSKTNETQTIFVFAHRQTAERALSALVDAGVKANRIDLLVHAKSQDGPSETELEHALEAGGEAGAGIGAIAGLVLFAIPGIGPVLGTGPLAIALMGGVVGGTAGGICGALTGATVSEVTAARAAYHVRQGGAVLLVRNNGDREAISKIVHSKGAVEEALA